MGERAGAGAALPCCLHALHLYCPSLLPNIDAPVRGYVSSNVSIFVVFIFLYAGDTYQPCIQRVSPLD